MADPTSPVPAVLIPKNNHPFLPPYGTPEEEATNAKLIGAKILHDLRDAITFYRMTHLFPLRPTDVQIEPDSLVKQFFRLPADSQRLVARVRLQVSSHMAWWSLTVVLYCRCIGKYCGGGQGAKIIQRVRDDPELFSFFEKTAGTCLRVGGDHLHDIHGGEFHLQLDKKPWDFETRWERGPNRLEPTEGRLKTVYGIDYKPRLVASNGRTMPYDVSMEACYIALLESKWYDKRTKWADRFNELVAGFMTGGCRTLIINWFIHWKLEDWRPRARTQKII